MKTKILLTLSFCFILITSHCVRGQVFTDVFSSTNLPTGDIRLIFDYDNDGKEDLVYIDSGSTIFKLLKNNGNGNFTDVTLLSNFPLLTDTTPAYDLKAVDIDNDGDYDVFYYETTAGSTYLHLWENRGGVFHDVTSCIGWSTPLPISLSTDGYLSFSFIDYDKDGDLDIIYNDYVNPSTILLRNDINLNGSFTQKDTLISGYPATRVFPFDFDNDGDFDFIGWQITSGGTYQTFNFQTIKLFRNDGGTFSDISSISGLTSANYYGGMNFFDYNNDGYIDILYGCTDNNFNASPDDKFFKNNGDGTFTDITSTNNVHYSNHYNGASRAVDYNNDGWDDICWGTSGFGMNHAPFYENQNGVYTENSQTLGLNYYYLGGQNWTGSRPWFDFNNDGLLDEFVGGGTPNYLFKNNTLASIAHYLNIKLQGCSSPTDPSGVRVVVFKNGNGQTRYYISGEVGSNIQTSKILNFGLGSNTDADSVNVYWPSGIITRLYNVSSNQDLVIKEDPNCTRTPSYIASSINRLNTSICQGDSVFAGGSYQTQAGTYLDYYPIAGTCDSLVVHNLTVNSIPSALSTITGPDSVCNNQTNLVFSVLPAVGTVSYNWSVPVGSTLISGGGTTSIEVTFGTGSGYVVVSAVNACGVGVPSTLYVVNNTCTGIGEIQGLTSLSVYPNPSSDNLFIQYDLNSAKDISISLNDVLGRDVIAPIIKERNNGTTSEQLSTHEISNGIYIVVIRSGDQSIIRRVIINH